MLIEEKIALSPKRLTKKVKYAEAPREGAKATKKESIVSKFSESYQINVMRKAILGDAEALKELQVIEDYINGL